MGLFPPQITEAVLCTVGIDKDLIGKCGGIERHTLPRSYRDGTFSPVLA